MESSSLRRNFFLLLLTAATLAFFWIVLPFFGAVMWAATLGLIFHPVNQWLARRLHGRANIAALITLLACLIIVVLPITMIGSSIATEITEFVQNARRSRVELAEIYARMVDALPAWATYWLDQKNLVDLQDVLNRISEAVLQLSQMIASRALRVGQNTFEYLLHAVVMVYLLFFFLRDGTRISMRIRESLPLKPTHTQFLSDKFATVVRATVKGNVIIAVVQGALGALAIWVLGFNGVLFWGVIMTLLSLIPAVGPSLVLGPMAIYLLSTGSVPQGVGLIVWTILAVGASENFLRPVLIGKDTALPDYIILLSTLGGISVFGMNGFVIGPTIAAMFFSCWALFNHDDGF